MDMAGQVLIKEKIGLSFPVVLRSILRQDPDVVLIGEIRDIETAEVAFHAALTGHLVYSTLHTNSAIATISRLLDLGLKPYVIASALEGIIAQRLVRKICEHGREPVQPTQELRQRLSSLFTDGTLLTYQGKGCKHCNNSGYRGRLGLYEVLIPDEELKHLMTSNSSIRDITQMAKSKGMRTLLDDARDKVAQGVTTLEEILRVLGPQ
jgi:type II secretory ATPase GspE/PulE/Tfp pilus assembly ATPase PilB-like protein